MPTYCTEYREGGRKMCGAEVEAASWAEAQRIAAEHGHRVIGVLMVEFPVSERVAERGIERLAA